MKSGIDYQHEDALSANAVRANSRTLIGLTGLG